MIGLTTQIYHEQVNKLHLKVPPSIENIIQIRKDSEVSMASWGGGLYKIYRHMVLFICINNYKYTPRTHLSFVLPPKQGLFQSKQGTFGFQVYIYIYVCA